VGLGRSAKRFVSNSPREFLLLLEKVIGTEVRGPYIKLLLARLRAARNLAIAGGKALVKLAERFLARTGELLALSNVMEERFTSLAHLFGDGLKSARANKARRKYFSLVDELRDILGHSGAPGMLEERTVRDIATTLRKQMTQSVSFGVFENYKDLTRETGLLNRMSTVLDPANEFKPSLRYSAHHIVEDRMYSAFAKEWKLIGWNSRDDMMATAVSYEAHIYSPKGGKLPGLPEDEEGLKALGKRLEAYVGKPSDYESAPDLIDAYIKFYRPAGNLSGTVGGAQTERVVDALKSLKDALKAAKRNR
jgi:hypothetical protein